MQYWASYKDYEKIKHEMIIDLNNGVSFNFMRKYGEYYRLHKYLQKRNFEYIETYNNNDIYGSVEKSEYVPYYDCNYYFKTLQDCKDKINSKLAVATF